MAAKNICQNGRDILERFAQLHTEYALMLNLINCITYALDVRCNHAETWPFTKRRTTDVAFYRQLLWFYARHLTSLSYPEIAVMFNRDHSTVIHGVSLIATALETPANEKTTKQTLICWHCKRLEAAFAKGEHLQGAVKQLGYLPSENPCGNAAAKSNYRQPLPPQEKHQAHY